MSDATLAVSVLLLLGSTFHLFICWSSGELNISHGNDDIDRPRQFADHADDTSYLRISLFQEKENPKSKYSTNKIHIIYIVAQHKLLNTSY